MRAFRLGSSLGLAMLAALAAPAALGVTPPSTGSTGDTGALVATAPGSTGDTGVPTVPDGTGQTGDTGTAPTASTGDTGASTGTDTGAGAGGTGDTGGPARLATAIADEVGGVRCDASGARPTPGLALAAAIALGATRARRRRVARTGFAAGLAAGLAVGGAAWAGPPPEPTTPQRDVHLLARGLIERWNDPAIATVYKSGTWLGAVGVAVDLVGPIGLDVEAGFGRLRGEGSAFEIAPLSALVSFTAPLGRVDAYAALGPAWTVFTETGGATAVDGARIAGELRGGVRIDTGLIQPARPPAPAPVRALELEVYLARRSELPGGATGLHLGAWRGSVGLGVVF